jgi:uncharacterized protein YbjT (DUF2867 family)
MVIVTGAAGRTGGEVVRLLSQRGIRVRAMVRDAKRAEGLKGPGIEVVVADLARPATLDPAFRGADKLFLVSSPDPDVEALHGNAIEAAKRTGIRHMVRLSAIGATQACPAMLLRVHGEVDEKLSRSGLSYTILRSHCFFQNSLMYAPTIASDGAIYGIWKDGAVGAIDNRDVALAAATVLTSNGHSGRIYDLTGPEAMTHPRFAEILSVALDRPVQYQDVPREAVRGALRGVLPDWLAEAYLDMVALFAVGKHAELSDAFERITSKKPRPYEQFARNYANAFGGAAKVGA